MELIQKRFIAGAAFALSALLSSEVIYAVVFSSSDFSQQQKSPLFVLELVRLLTQGVKAPGIEPFLLIPAIGVVAAGFFGATIGRKCLEVNSVASWLQAAGVGIAVVLLSSAIASSLFALVSGIMDTMRHYANPDSLDAVDIYQMITISLSGVLFFPLIGIIFSGWITVPLGALTAVGLYYVRSSLTESGGEKR